MSPFFIHHGIGDASILAWIVAFIITLSLSFILSGCTTPYHRTLSEIGGIAHDCYTSTDFLGQVTVKCYPVIKKEDGK